MLELTVPLVAVSVDVPVLRPLESQTMICGSHFPAHTQVVSVELSVSPHFPPVALTVATLVLLLDHVTVASESVLPLASFTVAPTAPTSPKFNDAEVPGVIVIEAGVLGPPLLLFPPPQAAKPRISALKNRIPQNLKEEENCCICPPRSGTNWSGSDPGNNVARKSQCSGNELNLSILQALNNSSFAFESNNLALNRNHVRVFCWNHTKIWAENASYPELRVENRDLSAR
jgi:hypothetical protein